MRRSFGDRFHRLFPLLAFAVAACGGQSCSCLHPIQGGFPTDERRHDNALQIRLTQGGLDYFSQNGKALVAALLPGGSTFDIPPSCGGANEVCCGNPQPMCQIDIGVQSFQLIQKPPATLSAVIRTQLVSKQPFPIAFSLIGKTHCMVAIDTTKGTNGHTDIGIAPDIAFTVDGTTHLTSLGLTTTITDLDPSMLSLTAQNPILDFACTLVQNVAAIKQFVLDQLKTQLQDQINKAAEGGFCAKCTAQADCDSFADACTGGKCMRMGKCLQEVGAAGRIDVGALFSSISPSTKAGLDTIAVLGGYAEVTQRPNGGVSLGMIGGAQGDPHAACVPMRPAPMPPATGKWMAEMGEVEPRTKKPYHLGLGIHQSHLNTLAWGAWDGGALCLVVGTAQQAMLNSKTLGLLMPSLGDLAQGTGPVYLVIRPQEEPQITIGDGTFTVDKMGQKTIKDPLLHVAVPNFAIDFYAFVDDRYVRILTVTADLMLPVSLDANGMGQLVPLLGDLSKAFTNVRVTNSELLAEPPAMLAKSFPVLLGIAVSQLGGSLKPIALPKVMGLDLSVVAIEPTDGKTFVSLFANLALAAMDSRPAATEAQIERVSAPPTEAFSVRGGLDEALAPRVWLALDGRGPEGGVPDLEWQWSLDGFTWSPWSSSRRQSASNPTLWLQGRHAITVRARVAGEPATTDPAPPRLEFLVDTVAPTGLATVVGHSAAFRAEDAVSPRERLEYRFVDERGGPPSEWNPAESATLPANLDPSHLRFEVRDEAGNVGTLDFHGRTTAPPANGGCGCGLGGKTRGNGGWAALGILALLGMIGRRRKPGMSAQGDRKTSRTLRLPLSRLLWLLPISGCHHSSDTMMPAPMLAKGAFLDPADQIGRFSDAVARGGVIHVSAYDDAHGDLAYAQVAEKDLANPPLAIPWQWVDGVPTDAAPTSPGGYRGGIGDDGDDVGQYTSIALDQKGRARIAYYDATHKRLKFAFADDARAFTTTAVDQLPAGRVGLYASLSLDAGDLPSIAYAAVEVPDGMGGFISRLRLATATTATPKTAADWTIVDLDQVAVPCAGLCANGQDCIQADPMDPFKKSQCKPADASCGMMCAKGEACDGGKCKTALAAPIATDLASGTGLFARLVRQKAGRAVAYYDHEQGDLDLQVEAAGTFTRLLVDGGSNETDVGQFAAAAVAPDDTLHLAYVDAIGDRLLYQTVSGGKPGMAAEVIDDGTRMDGLHPVGGGASIWTDGDTVKIAYQDQALSDLWVATRQGGAWQKAAAQMGATGYGFYPHLVADGGKLYLTGFAYDRAAQVQNHGNVGSLQIIALP